MNKFNILKEENKIKLLKTIETENNIIYTFSPKLNLNHSQNITNKNKEKKVPVYERLYTKNKYVKSVYNYKSFLFIHIQRKKVKKVLSKIKIIDKSSKAIILNIKNLD